jgi:hypothetical protein
MPSCDAHMPPPPAAPAPAAAVAAQVPPAAGAQALLPPGCVLLGQHDAPVAPNPPLLSIPGCVTCATGGPGSSGRRHSLAVKSAEAVTNDESSRAQLMLCTMPAWLPITHSTRPLSAWYSTTCWQHAAHMRAAHTSALWHVHSKTVNSRGTRKPPPAHLEGALVVAAGRRHPAAVTADGDAAAAAGRALDVDQHRVGHLPSVVDTRT